MSRVIGRRITRREYELWNTINERGEGRRCNDLNPNEVALLSKSEWKALCKEYHQWNGDPETFEERTNYILPDFAVLSFFRNMMREEIFERIKAEEDRQ